MKWFSFKENTPKQEKGPVSPQEAARKTLSDHKLIDLVGAMEKLVSIEYQRSMDEKILRETEQAIEDRLADLGFELEEVKKPHGIEGNDAVRLFCKEFFDLQNEDILKEAA